jgi:hypothetical protein
MRAPTGQERTVARASTMPEINCNVARNFRFGCDESVEAAPSASVTSRLGAD